MRERSSTARERGDSWSTGEGRAGSQHRSRTIASMPTIGESRLANHMQTSQDGSERGARAVTPAAVDKESGTYQFWNAPHEYSARAKDGPKEVERY